MTLLNVTTVSALPIANFFELKYAPAATACALTVRKNLFTVSAFP